MARALSTQSGVISESVDAYAIPQNIINLLPPALALHYAALPIRKEDGKLVLASESNIDPVSLAAIARKLKMPVKNILARHGQITVGLRHWYATIKSEDPKKLLENAIRAGKITKIQADKIWDYFVPRQFLFAEILMSLGRIDKASLNALLLQHESSEENLSQFLVGNNIISNETLKEALDLQKELQPNILDLIEKEAAAK